MYLYVSSVTINMSKHFMTSPLDANMHHVTEVKFVSCQYHCVGAKIIYLCIVFHGRSFTFEEKLMLNFHVELVYIVAGGSLGLEDLIHIIWWELVLTKLS